MVIFTKDMATGAVLNHGVSGYPCTGVAGEFNEQRRGEPWQVIVNDPIRSYMNAQNHIGIPMSTFNEPWTGGILQESNWSAQPYRVPIFGTSETPPTPNIPSILIAPIQYPSLIGSSYDQQLPNSRIHSDVRVPHISQQNRTFEQATMNGDNKVMMSPGNIFVNPNSGYFQGSTNGTGTHPQNDIAGQVTTGNTTRPGFTGGQTPFQKLPNGMSVAGLQANEPPSLLDFAPPPDPPVMPQTGTGMLAPTAPAWW